MIWLILTIVFCLLVGFIFGALWAKSVYYWTQEQADYREAQAFNRGLRRALQLIDKKFGVKYTWDPESEEYKILTQDV